MKLNLGCGGDIRPGYLNVDFRSPCDLVVDLSKTPWPFENGSADEILMLDFLEHFSYRKTDEILAEAWRVLRPDGVLEVQVPDFEICAAAATWKAGYFQCNACGNWPREYEMECKKCLQKWHQIAQSAIERLYGGQDFEGNFHFTAFTRELLGRRLSQNGFHRHELLEHNQNGETYAQNWNLKIRVQKKADLWGKDE